ncbi:sodium- and chloride-dependent glycine transporter 2 [Biomphalaria pfeifferi]|uniref:Transporter n=1 Tax=Biomphalaria pfeifferi TaxID=112525 RepID=A0AAD8FGK5_BIOPF|nr:sodium- and chloride-dependent glycine transporter 2 [Biomphalaria pfeifferi]
MALKGGSQSLGVNRNPDQSYGKQKTGKDDGDFYHSYDDIDSDYDKSFVARHPKDEADDDRRTSGSKKPLSNGHAAHLTEKDSKREKPSRENDREYLPPRRRGSPNGDYDRRRSPPGVRGRSSPDRRNSQPNRDYDRRRSPLDRRNSPPDRDYDRRHSPPDRRNSPPERDYDRRRSPPDRRHSPPDRDYDRRHSPPDRRHSPPNRDYDRRRSPLDRRNSPPDRDYDRRHSPPDRRNSPPERDYDRRRSPPDRRHSPPDRDYDRRRSPPDRRHSPPNRDYDRRRSPPDRRHSPPNRDYDRRRSPPDRKNSPPDRDYDRRRSSPDRDDDRRRSPSNRNRDRMRSPSDRDYIRKRSPSDRDYNRRHSPSDRDYDRKRSPSDRDYDRRHSPPERNYDRRHSPSCEREHSPFGRDNYRRQSPTERDKKQRRSALNTRHSPTERDSEEYKDFENKLSSDSSLSELKQDTETDTYEDPWDTTPSKVSDILENLRENHNACVSKAPRIQSYEDPVDSLPEPKYPSLATTKGNTYESYTPNFHGFDYTEPKQPQKEANNNIDKDKNAKDNDGYITLDLGGSDDRKPSKSRSKSNTPFSSQGSILSPEDFNDKKKLVYGQDENEERGNWTGKFDFILSLLGYAVGLGNVWRFPYLCYRNGGGAFLFPYLLMMVMIGLPLFYLEAALGQFTSCGATTCWQFAPLFKGLGIAMVISSTLTAIYYNMILGWALHYMFSSFTSSLPFLSCDNSWNTKDCKLKLPVMQCSGSSQSNDGLCLDENGKEKGIWNKTLFTEATGRKIVSPSQEYWEKNMLAFSDGIQNFGTPKWDLVLCLLLAWVICFFCLIKGIKSTGKVVYFTALFPYVVLFILLIRGATLENASEGIYFFITPNFSRLGDANVWKDAANQIFFSMGIAGGGLITLSSYNRFHNNIQRDAILVAVGDSLTCLLGGFVIFSYLGYMAGQLDVGVQDVAADGAGLAFVVYPEAISNLPPPTLWALLFFVMLLTLGLDSQFAMLETIMTGLIDQFPRLRPKKVFVILIICIVLFIMGLPLTSPGGMYMLQLMDNYVGGLTLIIIAFFEVISITYIYGVRRFCLDLHTMTGSTIFIYWKIVWCVVTPLTIAFIFIFMFIDYKSSTYGDYVYPGWADAMGWFMTLTSVLAIPIVMIYKICREKEGKTIWQRVCLLCLPSIYWGPALKKHRELITYAEGFQVDPLHSLQTSKMTKSSNQANTALNGSAKSPYSKSGVLNLGYDDSMESMKAESQRSLFASRMSVLSTFSKGTHKSEKSGFSFESNV